jgi:hypothetical protein
MSSPDPIHEPLEIERLLTNDERRLTVEAHHDWRESLSESRPFDEIDLECDDMTIVDPYEIHAPSRRSDKEINRLLSILDSLETSNTGRGNHG